MSNYLFYLLVIAVIVLLDWILIRINHAIFKGIQKRRKGLHLLFFERINTVIIIILGVVVAIAAFGGLKQVWTTLVGGTAIISAVAIFAAQDALKDILAGMMISLYKPFEIGNRIQLEDGTAGIIKDLTMRHVVLQLWDTQQMIIPNSKINTMIIRNYSYHASYRSAPMIFQVSYDSDVEKVKEVIAKVIEEYPYTIPSVPTENGMAYSDVYFRAYRDSSLEFGVTAYYEATSRSEVVISDLNTRINHAFQENGIEIPYAFVNIVDRTAPEHAEEKERQE